MRKIQSGTQLFLNKSPFLCFPIEHWMGYQQDSFSMASLMCLVSQDIVSGFYFERQHSVSVHLMALCVFLAQKTEVAIFPPSLTEKSSVPVDILSNRYLKNTLRIDYKRLPCFCRYYGANLEYFSALSWLVFPVVFSAKREELTEIIFLEKRTFAIKPGVSWVKTSEAHQR